MGWALVLVWLLLVACFVGIVMNHRTRRTWLDLIWKLDEERAELRRTRTRLEKTGFEVRMKGRTIMKADLLYLLIHLEMSGYPATDLFCLGPMADRETAAIMGLFQVIVGDTDAPLNPYSNPPWSGGDDLPERL